MSLIIVGGYSGVVYFIHAFSGVLADRIKYAHWPLRSLNLFSWWNSFRVSEGEIKTAPVVDDSSQTIWVTCRDGKLVALKVGSEVKKASAVLVRVEEIGSIELSGTVAGAARLEISENLVFIGTQNGNFHCFLALVPFAELWRKQVRVLFRSPSSC